MKLKLSIILILCCVLTSILSGNFLILVDFMLIREPRGHSKIQAELDQTYNQIFVHQYGVLNPDRIICCGIDPNDTLQVITVKVRYDPEFEDEMYRDFELGKIDSIYSKSHSSVILVFKLTDLYSIADNDYVNFIYAPEKPSIKETISKLNIEDFDSVSLDSTVRVFISEYLRMFHKGIALDSLEKSDKIKQMLEDSDMHISLVKEDNTIVPYFETVPKYDTTFTDKTLNGFLKIMSRNNVIHGFGSRIVSYLDSCDYHTLELESGSLHVTTINVTTVTYTIDQIIGLSKYEHIKNIDSGEFHKNTEILRKSNN